MSLCTNNEKAKSCFGNGVSSYASDYITNKRKKCVKKCVDRRKEVNTTNIAYGLVTTKNYTDITVICKVGPKVGGGEFVCDAPTDIYLGYTPFYQYYNIPVNY
uniref:Uncharacterized protein n=1 Tax=viral metagenome TaxID=1070528 RepID=A0A6C0HAP5_9ZZZZ